MIEFLFTYSINLRSNYFISFLEGVFYWTPLIQDVSHPNVCQLQDGEKQMGNPMVCQGKLLAGIASSYNPGLVYTPISDYLTWIRTNQIIHYDTDDDKWK